MSDAATMAQTDVEASEPVIWLLGKTQSGKTSIVAEITGQLCEEIGSGFEPKTKGSSVYPFPPDCPILRFLDTRGLADVESYDPASDVASAKSMAHIIMAVVRIDDLHIDEIVSVVKDARKAHPQWPLVVAQTTLHNCYPKNTGHVLPYPFGGNNADLNIPNLPGNLRKAMTAQRAMFSSLPGKGPIFFVPLDFTQPSQGLPPSNYGSDRLLDVLEQVLHDVMVRVRDGKCATVESAVRTKIILPWAFAAAAANAVPIPVLGGFGSASLQAVMVRTISQRFGLDPGLDMWREFLSAMGTGFALGFGAGWLTQQVLKLGIGWGSAAVAAWTFAITWGIGEAALYYFRERAANRDPDPAEMHSRYNDAFQKAKEYYRTSKEQRS